MFNRFQDYFQQNFSELQHEKFLIAISGGVDSVVLAHLCKKMNLNFSLAHCNFMLRDDESNEDEKFVKSLAEKLEVNFFVQHFNTSAYAQDHQLSTQIAARNLRYHWFYELVKIHNFKAIFTAHHANDSLETYFINTIRGTGINGLTGIPEINHKIVRPLLNFSRAEIELYAKKNNITWREDSSNASDKYVRNKIRNQLIPVLEEITPQYLQNFQQTQTHLQQSAALLEDYTTFLFSKLVEKIKGDYYLNIQQLQETPNTKAVLYQLLHPFGFTEWDDVYHLLSAESGKQVFSKTHRLVRDRAVLILAEKQEIANEEFLLPKNSTEISFPLGKIEVEEVDKIQKKEKQIAYLAAEKLKFPLKVRRWKTGDVFKPFGMKGKKKISDFLKDEKCSLVEKENTWVLCSAEDIIWVIGHRIHNDYKITPTTTQTLKITLKK
ncbi:tRNA lysidine(34) synthetase TilS [Mesonia aquimarina]|uniref:tRNA lysidine(34) synthetase TilS n=1 Tax=Mesonia aquimarina TaxID=1504967 RepID=UPI000EF5D181|nr:tRNA lysidine(34) synthetase TilS [Mesonia aquimarina]